MESKWNFLAKPPRFLFFTGKGGVGKTSIACATAIHLSRSSKKVLLVSTDPASNVAQVIGQPIGNSITPISTVANLSALEIDPEAAASAYREKIIGPIRNLLPQTEIDLMAEQLSGSCTTEIASFNEFTDLLVSSDLTKNFDHIVFDTAPTGHTIRLLQLPGSWTDFLNTGKGDASCLGPLSGLEKQRLTYAEAVLALQDPGLTRLVLVSRAQKSALVEVERTLIELRSIHIAGTSLVINGVMPKDLAQDTLVETIRSQEAQAMEMMSENLKELAIDLLPLKVQNMVGIAALVSLLDSNPGEEVRHSPTNEFYSYEAPLSLLIDEIEKVDHGLIMCMGKGGVGKTTIAAAIAVSLANRGHEVTLTTTDPAAHLSQTLHGGVENLSVSRIDPESATIAYQNQVLKTKGKNLDDDGLAALREDLRSPCTEEVAVFKEFSQAVHESRSKFVVLDTAPTGHTLLLLDATGCYHREVARQMGDSKNFTTPLMRLQDQKLTKVLIVTLAEPTPVQEATELQEDLKRAGIVPFAWVINNSIAAAKPTSPFLRARALNEFTLIEKVKERAPRLALIPFMAEEPVGEKSLLKIAEN